MNNNLNENNNNKKKIILIFEKASVPYYSICFLKDKFKVAIQKYRESSKDISARNFYIGARQIANYDATIEELKIKDTSYILVKDK